MKKKNEWLSYTPIQGIFLSNAVLNKHFKEGFASFSAIQPKKAKIWKDAYKEFLENPHDVALQGDWIRFVLDCLHFEAEDFLMLEKIPTDRTTRFSNGETFSPSYLLFDKTNQSEIRLSIFVIPYGVKPDVAFEKWEVAFSPISVVSQYLKERDEKLALLTNGEDWILVSSPDPSKYLPGYAWFSAELFSEKSTSESRDVFYSFLQKSRFFSVPADQTPESLLKESLNVQEEITDALGEQVRNSVEVLLRTIDKQDRERGFTLLSEIRPEEIYEAALFFMMRIVILLYAEERDLAPNSDIYVQHYSVTGLAQRLQEEAFEEEKMASRFDAFPQLLALFRLLYSGLEDVQDPIIAYGGSLFDPDRFPFLEGRKKGSSWLDPTAVSEPWAIDNRTVHYLLQSIQFLQKEGELRKISFRTLDIEQIGYVYETLLDFTAKRAEDGILLSFEHKEGGRGLFTFKELVEQDQKGTLYDFLSKETKKSIREGSSVLPEGEITYLSSYVGTNSDLLHLVQKIGAHLRKDPSEPKHRYLIQDGSLYVSPGTDRASTGTHYTPRILTQEVVKHTLDPLCYEGPEIGLSEDQWKLKPAEDLLQLKICDMAVGSGAFLVEVARYLSERIVQSWKKSGVTGLAKQNEEEQLTYARRLVAERCLYGVDKNPLAVEMAKLSLWLSTFDPKKPFTFVDHAIRCGDSLIGSSLQDILTLTDTKEGSHVSTGLSSQPLQELVNQSLEMRMELEDLASDDPMRSQEKQYLLSKVKYLSEILWIANDCLTGMRLLNSDSETVRNLLAKKLTEMPLDRLKTMMSDSATMADVFLETLKKDPVLWTAYEEGKRVRSFSWDLEFPEVFQRADKQGFDAFVGNPPFLGGKKISGSMDTNYREYIVDHIARGKKGSADFVAYFFLRAFSYLCEGGNLGLLSTNTISQGDTREVGLDQILSRGGKVFRATPSDDWPGKAGVKIAKVFLHKGDWKGGAVLSGQNVSEINAYLSQPGKIAGNPHILKANQGKSFQGSIVLGMGFVLTPEEAMDLVQRNPKLKDALYPYLNGEDLNQNPDQKPSRWVINFFDWPLERSASGSWWQGWNEGKAIEEKGQSFDPKTPIRWMRWQTKEPWDCTPSTGFTFYEDPKSLPKDLSKERKKWLQEGKVPADYPYPVARDYPELIAIVEEKVKPERETKSEEIRAYPYWRFWRSRAELYRAIAGQERVLVKVLHSPAFIFSLQGTNFVFSHALGVITNGDYYSFGFLNSYFHEIWSWKYSSTLGHATLRYSGTDCFETFPFPDTNESKISYLSEIFDASVKSYLIENNIGLTSFINDFHSIDNTNKLMSSIRSQYCAINLEISNLYKWDFENLDFDFNESKLGLRYSIRNTIKEEVLDRLLELNHKRYAEEVSAGLWEKNLKTKNAVKKKSSQGRETDAMGSLFGGEG